MSLLVMQRVFARFSAGQRHVVALKDVSLDVAAGEFVAVWGMRRSGRTTLLRVASGMLAPDGGMVCFDGRDVGRSRAEILGVEIGYCSPVFEASQGGTIVDRIALGLIAQGTPVKQATERALAALDRAGAGTCANLDPRELHPHELARAGIARALVTKPRLLLLDEPTSGIDLLQRDPLLDLLRSLTDDGIAVLMTVGETVGGADRVLIIDDGQLRGDSVPTDAPVVPLRPARAERRG